MEFVETYIGAGWLRIASLGSSTSRYNLQIWKTDGGRLTGRGTVFADIWSLIEARGGDASILVLANDRRVRVEIIDIFGPEASFVIKGPLDAVCFYGL